MPARPETLILASGSAARQSILSAAGLTFAIELANVDEPALRDSLAESNPSASPADVADALAVAKARDVSRRFPEAFVIGSDQVLDCEGQLLSKPMNEAGVRATLDQLSGRAHALHAAVAVARGGESVWTSRDTAVLTMRTLSASDVDWYVAAAGQDIYHSVGAYHIEGIGVQLFQAVDGDHFTIRGMPLLPLLHALRQLGVLPS